MVSHPGRWLGAPAVGPVLICLLAAVCGLSQAQPAALGEPGDLQAGAAPQAPPVAGQAPPAAPDFAYFERLQKQAAEQRKQADERHRKIREVAQQHLDAQAKARGGPAQVRRDLGASLADLNARLPRPAGQTPPPDANPGPRIEPGMRVDILMKDGANYYTGTLVGIDGTTVLLQTIPEPGVKPEPFDLSNIQAFHTSAGFFAYNPVARKFVPALTYYRLNKATGNFERAESGSGDAFLAETAKILGPTSSAMALVGTAADGSLDVGLPVPTAESPRAIPASSFQEIVTSLGVYTYDPVARDFTYQTHAQIAQAAQQQRDAAGQSSYQKQWVRRMQEYQLKTNRIQAAQPYFTASWVGGPSWQWWQPPGPKPTPPPGGPGNPRP